MSNYPSGHFPRLPIDVYMQVIDDSDEVPKINFKKFGEPDANWIPLSMLKYISGQPIMPGQMDDIECLEPKDGYLKEVDENLIALHNISALTLIDASALDAYAAAVQRDITELVIIDDDYTYGLTGEPGKPYVKPGVIIGSSHPNTNEILKSFPNLYLLKPKNNLHSMAQYKNFTQFIKREANGNTVPYHYYEHEIDYEANCRISFEIVMKNPLYKVKQITQPIRAKGTNKIIGETNTTNTEIELNIGDLPPNLQILPQIFCINTKLLMNYTTYSGEDKSKSVPIKFFVSINNNNIVSRKLCYPNFSTILDVTKWRSEFKLITYNSPKWINLRKKFGESINNKNVSSTIWPQSEVNGHILSEKIYGGQFSTFTIYYKIEYNISPTAINITKLNDVLMTNIDTGTEYLPKFIQGKPIFDVASLQLNNGSRQNNITHLSVDNMPSDNDISFQDVNFDITGMRENGSYFFTLLESPFLPDFSSNGQFIGEWNLDKSDQKPREFIKEKSINGFYQYKWETINVWDNGRLKNSFWYSTYNKAMIQDQWNRSPLTDASKSAAGLFPNVGIAVSYANYQHESTYTNGPINNFLKLDENTYLTFQYMDFDKITESGGFNPLGWSGKFGIFVQYEKIDGIWNAINSNICFGGFPDQPNIPNKSLRTGYPFAWLQYQQKDIIQIDISSGGNIWRTDVQQGGISRQNAIPETYYPQLLGDDFSLNAGDNWMLGISGYNEISSYFTIGPDISLNDPYTPWTAVGNALRQLSVATTSNESVTNNQTNNVTLGATIILGN